MDVLIKDKDQSQKELQVTIPADEMEQYAQKAAVTLGKDLEVKGFRKGNAPLDVVKKHVGETKIWEQAAEDAFSSSYAEAVREQNLAVISSPQLQITKLAPHNEFVYRATVAVFPDITLPDVSSVAQKIAEKETRDIEISEEEVDKALEWLRNSRAKEEEGEKKVPELNDAFAKEVGGFANVAELRKSIAEGMHQEKAAKEQERVRLLQLQEIAKQSSLTVPQLLIDEERHKMMRELEGKIQQMGMTLEDYLSHVKKTKEEIMEGWAEQARERVEAGMVLQAIADKEHIAVSDEEVEERVKHYTAHYASPEEAEKHLGDPNSLRAYVRGVMRNEKVFAVLDPAMNAGQAEKVDRQEN